MKKKESGAIHQFCEDMRHLEGLQQQWDSLYKTLNHTFGATSEGTLTTTVDALFDYCVDKISVLWGDKQEWIKWYIYENHWGTNGMSCSVGERKPMRKIDNTKKLYAIIKETSEQ